MQSSMKGNPGERVIFYEDHRPRPPNKLQGHSAASGE